MTFMSEQEQARVQELEKELEEKENDLIRDLRSSKKLKADQAKSVNITANDGFPCTSVGYRNQSTKLDEVMQEPCNDKPDLNRLKPEVKSVPNSNGNLDNKNADVIELDADDSTFGDERKAQFSSKTFGTSDSTLDSQNKSSLCQNDNRQSTAFECTITHVAKEASFLKHREASGKSTSLENLRAKLHIPQESFLERANVTTSTWEKEILTIDGISKQATRLTSGTGPQQIHNFNSLSGESLCYYG
jgi:TRAF-interacting protein